MRVLLVDDHMMFLQGMSTLLAVLAPDIALETASDAAEALRAVQCHDYEIVMLDWNLGREDASNLVADMRSVGCRSRVVVVSGETDEQRIAKMLESGIAGFIPKTYTGERLLDALDRTLRGEIHLPDGLHPTLPRGRNAIGSDAAQFNGWLAQLTPRQLATFKAAARGLPNKLIAREMGVTEATIKSHLSTVYAVLGVTNRTQAALLASRVGLRL